MTDGYLRFISTIGQTTVPFYFRVVIFSGGLKNIDGQTTVPFFFRVVIFWGRNWCLYFDSSTNYGIYIRPEKITTRKKVQSSGRLCFSAGSNYNWKKLRPEKKRTVVWPTVEIHVFRRVQITTGKKFRPKQIKGTVIWHCVKIRTPIITKLEKITTRKKNNVHSSGRWLEHKTQNTTHTDTTTNKMSRATPPSSGFAPSLSMGRAVALPNHGAAAPQRHAQAASRRGCARCRWFACMGRQNKRHRIIERGGVPWP
jgi:hypothetical protein